VRAISGAFGKWSLPTDNFNFARHWINYYKGWGKFSVAQYLSPDSITWLSIWKDGELIVAQGRKRLYWEFANRSVSGVTGITGTGVTVSDKKLDTLAIKAIKAIDDFPNGIYGVDLTYDTSGVPNPTEINIGRFFTTHQFFTEAGLNMPYIYIKLAFGEKLPPIKKKINPLPNKLAWVRGMDVEPVLIPLKEIESFEDELKERLKRIK
jgi:carbamoyl-phosphate synthase large subunit